MPKEKKTTTTTMKKKAPLRRSPPKQRAAVMARARATVMAELAEALIKLDVKDLPSPAAPVVLAARLAAEWPRNRTAAGALMRAWTEGPEVFAARVAEITWRRFTEQLELHRPYWRVEEIEAIELISRCMDVDVNGKINAAVALRDCWRSKGANRKKTQRGMKGTRPDGETEKES